MQPRPAADVVQAQGSQDDRGDQQDHGLDGVGIDDGAQAAFHRIEGGQQADHPDDGELVPAEHGGEDDGRGPQRDRDLGQHGENQHQRREKPPDAGAVAPLQELGDGVDLVLQIERQEQQDQRQEAEDGHPFEAAHGQADGEPAAGQADEVLRGDVGGEKRRPDERPLQLPVRQKVALTGLGLSGRVKPNRDDDHDIDGDDRPVQRMQVHSFTV